VGLQSLTLATKVLRFGADAAVAEQPFGVFLSMTYK